MGAGGQVPRAPTRPGRPSRVAVGTAASPPSGGSMALDEATTARLKDALATVVVIPVTPMRPDGSIEWGTYTDLIRRVVDTGITVITANGNTGGFYALSPAEARQAPKQAVRAPSSEAGSGGRAEVLVGVGQDTATAIDAARHAQQAGAQMIMIHQAVPPYQSAGGGGDHHPALAAAG